MNKKIKLMISLEICLIVITTAFANTPRGVLSEVDDDIDKFFPLKSSSYIHINISKANNHASKLETIGFDVLHHTVTATSFEMIATPTELIMLKEMGYSPIVLSHGRPFRDIQAERLDGLDQVPPGYPDLSEILIQMNNTSMEQ